MMADVKSKVLEDDDKIQKTVANLSLKIPVMDL